jgi:uncharacterized membrane protein
MKRNEGQSSSDPQKGLESEEILLRELEQYPKQKLSKDDVNRVALMVNEYQGKIKSHLHEQQEKKATCMDRFADRVAKFGGSWRFVILLGIILTAWLLWDSSRTSLFIVSFALSIFTAFQVALIQSSQNRQAGKDKQEQMLDIAINYKAEQENLEIQNILRSIDERLQSMEKWQDKD